MGSHTSSMVALQRRGRQAPSEFVESTIKSMSYKEVTAQRNIPLKRIA